MVEHLMQKYNMDLTELVEVICNQLLTMRTLEF